MLIILSLTFALFHVYKENYKLRERIRDLKDRLREDEIVNYVLREKIRCKENGIDYLERKLFNISVKLALLEDEVSRLKLEVYGLKYTVKELKKILRAYDYVPKYYYTYDLRELSRFLKHLTIPHRYKKNVFDCSEISAFIEWALENAGFHAEIAVGSRYGVGHAWVIVKLPNGSECYVDFRCCNNSCRPVIVSKKGYRVYMVFETIYDAVRAYGGVGEWDWWNVLKYRPNPSDFHDLVRCSILKEGRSFRRGLESGLCGRDENTFTESR